jgi:hypothetical protein
MAADHISEKKEKKATVMPEATEPETDRPSQVPLQ